MQSIHDLSLSYASLSTASGPMLENYLDFDGATPLAALRVLHLPKTDGQMSGLDFVPGSFRLDTCQRWVEIFTNEDCGTTSQISGTEVYSSADAYAFLLRLASGLESELIGEANVFGQVKKAWSEYSGKRKRALRRVMNWLFQDTKHLRSNYLQGIGSASYGGLVRRLLKNVSDPILVIGAGHLARSISPWLLDHELWLWNRGKAALEPLSASLSEKPGARFRVVTDELAAWREAGAVVVCIPAGADGDDARIASWLSGPHDRTLVHLGCRRGSTTSWNRIDDLYYLDDLFELQRGQGLSAGARIASARQTCTGLALDRIAEAGRNHSPITKHHVYPRCANL